MNCSERTIIVTPVFEDTEASSRLFKELRSALGSECFIVAVDDGSVREPVSETAIEAAGLPGVVIRLKRNVGHQRAIAIGLSYVAKHLTDYQVVVVMDSDGEDLPGSIPALLANLSKPSVDIVVAKRGTRVETLRFRAFYRVYKAVFSTLAGRDISFGNFMAMTPSAVRRMTAMQELWLHVAASVLTSRLRIEHCQLDRGPRYAGQSKMNFVGLALHGFRALMVFAEDVLVRVGIVCAGIAVLSILGSVVAIGLKLAHFATPGWFSVALGILFLVFLQTGALTLMTLMLTGVVRNGGIANSQFDEFIDIVLHTHATEPRP